MLRDAHAGFVTATMALAYSLSTSALIFTGPIQKFLGIGVAAALTTAFVSALVTSFGSGFTIAIAGPSSTVAAALAVTIATLDPLLARMPDQNAVALVLVVLAMTTLGAGAAMVFIGFGRLGRVVRYVPYPVIAGFMAASGWFLASGAIAIATQTPFTLASATALIRPDKATELGATFAWAAVLALATARIKNPTLTPVLLVGVVLAVNGAVAWLGVSRGDPRLGGLFFDVRSPAIDYPPFLPSLLSRVDWLAIPSLGPSMLAVILVTVFTVLLGFSGLETALDTDGDFDRELKVQGAANILVGLGGGFIGTISTGATAAARLAGARGRVCGYVTALVCFAVLFGGITLVNVIPRFVVGGLQLMLGMQALWRWCIASRGKMPLSEWLLVLGVTGIAIGVGFVPSILCGIVGGCVIYAFDVSRINVIRGIHGIDERASPLVRSDEESRALAAHGASAKIVELGGYLFFGSAYQLLARLRDLVASGALGMVVLDFTAVTGADFSTAAVLRRLEALARAKSVALVLAGLRPDVARVLRDAAIGGAPAVVFADRNAALEHAERFVLASAGTPTPETIPFMAWLERGLGHPDLARALVPFLERADVPAGDYLCRQGEPTDTLIFIERGRVAVMVKSGVDETCVRVFGPRTIAGEQGFILRQPRAASLKVEVNARIWSLPRHAFVELTEKNPGIVIALMRDILRLQSERLNFATRRNVVLAS
jgi:SulP family sulfate permease